MLCNLQNMPKMLYLMKKELSTSICKLFILFIINDVKEKNVCLLGKNKIRGGELHYLRESIR